jgi:hypothetical protein
MPGFAGLRTDTLTWVIMAGMTACWMFSLRLVPNWKRDGWTSLLKSLYGFVWLDFGLDIVLRFSMLAYNAVEWGNGTLRLVAQPVITVNTTLEYCGMFWLLLALAYTVAVRRRGAGPLGAARSFTPEFAYAAAIPFALLASVVFYLIDGQSRLPLELITPLALLANFYMVPAVIVWWDHFRQSGSKRHIGSIHMFVLLPALVHGVRSPYRENLAPIFLIPLIAAMFAGKRPSLAKMVPAALMCLLVLSTVVSSYRRIKWQNVRPEEVAREFGEGGFRGWLSGASDEPVRRFHAFDSLLLTVALVPALEPYSERNVLVSPLIRGVVPRFIYSGKSGADAGMNFGPRIWAFDDPAARENSGASIAPSMPGDLFDAGGVLYIALGALIWGTLLGLVDGWKSHLPPFCAAAVTVLVATQCAMSVERDFDNSIATFIQTLLVFVLVSGLLAVARRGGSDYSIGLNPSLERP